MKGRNEEKRLADNFIDCIMLGRLYVFIFGEVGIPLQKVYIPNLKTLQ